MAIPRKIVPGTTYLVTRRTTQRQFLLRPDATTNQILSFCLAVAAKRHGIVVHAACVLSTHLHLVLTDPRGELPKFEEWMNKYSAKCLNNFRRRFENLWAFPGSYSAVKLEGEGDFLRKVVYVLSNPVKAGLVAYGAQWPGLRFAIGGVGKQGYTVERPGLYFRRFDNLVVPAQASLTLARPSKFFAELSDEEFSEKLQSAVFEQERTLREQFRRTGRTFLGRAAVLAQNPFSYASGYEPRFGINPRVASIDKWKRVEALQALKGFLEAHAQAMRRWIDGDREVEFPFGTYLMNVLHRAKCAPAPS